MSSRDERPPEDRRNIDGKDGELQRKRTQKKKGREEESSEVDTLKEEMALLKKQLAESEKARKESENENKNLRIDAFHVEEDREEDQLAVHRQWIVNKFTTFCDSIPDNKSGYHHGEDHFLHVDLNSPLHWENRCPWCGVNRTLGPIWPRCPRQFRHLWFGTLREFAICRSVIEKAKNIEEHVLDTTMNTLPLPMSDLTEAIVEQTIRATCTHALRTIAFPRDGWRFRVSNLAPHLEMAYRSGLGEFVDESTSFGAILHRPGLSISNRGGDSSHWEWRMAPARDWEAILEGWINGSRRLKKVLIFWPRNMPWSAMNQLRDKIKDCTATHTWSTVIIPEPGPAKTPQYGCIRVIINSSATDDGTAAWNLQQIHPWIRRDHWEFAAEAWTAGRKWNPIRAKNELTKWGFHIAPEHLSKAERDAEKKKKKNRSDKKRHKARNSNASKRMKEQEQETMEYGSKGGHTEQEVVMDDWMMMMITGQGIPIDGNAWMMEESGAGPSTR